MISRCPIALALGLVLTAVPNPAADPVAPPAIGKVIPVPPNKIPTIPPALIDDGLNIGGDDITARMVSTRMTVEVGINGRGPYRFLVDSGADTSVVGVRIARNLQLPAASPAVLHGMTGSARVARVSVDQLRLGPSDIPRLTLPVLKEEDLGAHGIVGIDALVEQRLMLDFEKRLIKVEDARLPVVEYDGTIVVRARRQRGQLILTQVTANEFPIEAVIDTGSEITIGNLALRDKLIRGNRGKFITVPVTGVTGVTINLQLARIAELKLGTVTLRDVPMAFADVPPFTVFDLDDGPALLLGTDLLETFRRISLDFRARKVRFQLRRCGSSGIIVATSPSAIASRIISGGKTEACKR
jgi:hypothetical protein